MRLMGELEQRVEEASQHGPVQVCLPRPTLKESFVCDRRHEFRSKQQRSYPPLCQELSRKELRFKELRFQFQNETTLRNYSSTCQQKTKISGRGLRIWSYSSRLERMTTAGRQPGVPTRSVLNYMLIDNLCRRNHMHEARSSL